MRSGVFRWLAPAVVLALLMANLATPGRQGTAGDPPDSQGTSGKQKADGPKKAADSKKATDSKKTESAAKKNPLAGCQLCHVDVEDEFVESLHFREKVACTECHGPSKGHIADENNEVKPDEIFARMDVDRLCSECHDCSRTIPRGWSDLPLDKRQVCNECHRSHASAKAAAARAKTPPKQESQGR